MTGANWASVSYGDAIPARGILLLVHIAISTISLLLLIVRDPKPVAELLLVHVVYKLNARLNVGTLTAKIVCSKFFSPVAAR
jgi:hypothetical protein